MIIADDVTKLSNAHALPLLFCLFPLSTRRARRGLEYSNTFRRKNRQKK